MQDTFNLGWKLASVLQSRCVPELLHTYSAERHAIAKELIDFDREWAKMLSAPLKSHPDCEGVDPAEVQEYFVRHARYTAGTATKYGPSLICAAPRYQHLAVGFVIGTRFHSAPVIRLADAKLIRLGDTIKADGRWRIFIFADSLAPSAPSSRARALCSFLAESSSSPVRKYTPARADVDSRIDVRAIFQQSHRDLNLEAMPPFLLPTKGRYGLRDYEKMFCACGKGKRDVFDVRGIDRNGGCVVVVRPDQYVADVLPLDACDELSDFFDRLMLPTH